MMRKDVKVGLASGAVLLAVGIVYVSSINQPPTARQVSKLERPGAASERGNSTNNPTASGANGGSRIVMSEPSRSPAPAERLPVTETIVNVPTEQDWSKLLGTGTPPALMSHTPAPGTTAGTTSASATATTPDAAAATGGDPFGTMAESTPISAQSTAQQTAAGVAATTALPGTPVAPTLSATITTPATVTPALQVETVLRSQPGSANVPTAAAGATQLYTVKEGESFYTIARAVYGDSHFFPHIQRANPDVVPNKIRAGMKINLPSPESVKPTAAAAARATERQSDRVASDAANKLVKTVAAGEYRVQENENLYRIAVKLYGSPKKVDEIYEMNKATIGSDPSKLKVGTVLKLPAGAKATR
jgi:nucleoid-associated protein YgaU